MKKTITATTLAIVMMFGATIANANGGIIVGGRAEGDGNGGIIVGGKAEKSCKVKGESSVSTGIIVGGRTELGAVVAFLEGIIVVGRTISPCEEKTGIIVSDRDGVIVSN